MSSGRSSDVMGMQPNTIAPFDIVFVCTGNRARSPLAEALYRLYTRGIATTVSSYGTLDVGPAAALPDALDVAASLGIDLSEHRARPLAGSSLVEADLVLGFEPHHVSAAVIDAHAPADRTFLLAELVGLLESDRSGTASADRARTRVADVGSRRVRIRDAADPFVIGDPIGKPADAMVSTGRRIDALVQQLVLSLFGQTESLPAQVDDLRKGSRVSRGWRRATGST
jgi:protein-tyrosine-phosphatase